MGPETSMEVQAKLGSDIALVFDECTPFNVDREYTARSTERTHRWLGPLPGLARRARPGGAARLRDRPGRRLRGPAHRVDAGGRRPAGRRDRDRRLARRRQAADVRGRRLGDRRARRRRRARATCSASATSTTSSAASSSASTRSTARCRRAWAATASRSCPTPTKRWRVDLTAARIKEDDEPIMEGCPCPACSDGPLARLPALPRQEPRADRRAAADAAQPRVPRAAHGRPARRDRRGTLRERGRGAARGRRAARRAGARGRRAQALPRVVLDQRVELIDDLAGVVAVDRREVHVRAARRAADARRRSPTARTAATARTAISLPSRRRCARGSRSRREGGMSGIGS